jgi:hypothetical protein
VLAQAAVVAVAVGQVWVFLPVVMALLVKVTKAVTAQMAQHLTLQAAAAARVLSVLMV